MLTNLNLILGQMLTRGDGVQTPLAAEDSVESLVADFATLWQEHAGLPVPAAPARGDSLPSGGNALPADKPRTPAADPEDIVASLNRRLADVLRSPEAAPPEPPELPLIPAGDDLPATAMPESINAMPESINAMPVQAAPPAGELTERPPPASAEPPVMPVTAGPAANEHPQTHGSTPVSPAAVVAAPPAMNADAAARRPLTDRPNSTRPVAETATADNAAANAAAREVPPQLTDVTERYPRSQYDGQRGVAPAWRKAAADPGPGAGR